MIDIVVNGVPQKIPPGSMLVDLLGSLELDPSRVAVELDRRIVRQDEWHITPIRDGAAIEIVHFVGGG